MMRSVLLVLCFVTLLAGCSKAQVGAVAPPGAVAPSSAAKANSPAEKRHIELRHRLLIEVAESSLEAVWRGRVQACQPPACEVISAGFENRREGNASATLSLRIEPAQVAALLTSLGQLGTLAQHEMTQTDRSNEVIDIQARLTNQKALRDRLRALVSGKVDKLHDLIELESELARVQGEIDSAEAQLRATLALTEKTSVDITFRTPASLERLGFWQPLREAWGQMGHVLAESVSALMLFIAAVLPWSFVFVALFLGLRRLLRWRKARMAGPSD